MTDRAARGGQAWRNALSGLCAGVLVVLSLVLAGPPAGATSPNDVPWTVRAQRQALTSSATSPVSHDNEVMALAAHDGKLFAATDQWEYPGKNGAGQVLVKNSARAPWTVFEQTQVLRVQAIDSFAIPADQGMGSGHSLLVTQVIVHGDSVIQWLLDGATSFTPANSYVLPSLSANVRSFGAHEANGTWAVYAGVEPDGVLRGVWSKSRHTLVFSRVPELTAAPPGSPGLRTQKVTGFTECAGALYVTINTNLYRRNDGTLPAGTGRWVLLYQEPPVASFNSGLRGVSCVRHDGRSSLLLSTEGTGDVYRLDALPTGIVDASASATPGHGVVGLSPILEFAPVQALREVLGQEGTPVPAKGKGSIDYVIAAYNNFESITTNGVTRQYFGVEHAYLGACLPGRTCGPTSFGLATFDAAACFAVRTDDGQAITYQLRCLGGPDFTPSGSTAKPIRSGQAFVSIRTITPSPFGDGRIYYGGYDCNFYPADGTAWVGSSTVAAIHL